MASVTTIGNENFDEEIAAVVAAGRTDAKVLQKREEEAVKSVKVKESTRNRNASKEGQAIFDWFSRQYVFTFLSYESAGDAGANKW